MPQGLLLLPLLGGFLLLHLTHIYRLQAQRWDGYRLLLASAVAGACLLALGRVLVILFGLIPTFGPWAGTIWHRFSPFPHSDSCIWSLILGPLIAWLGFNRIYGIDRAKDRELTTHRRADAFTRLLHVAARDKRLISVTLDTRKWYVGLVAEAPNLNPEEKYFRLLPLVSGFRDKDTLQTYRTVYYEDVLDEQTVDPDDLVITLPIEDVRSANLFDPDIYQSYFAEETSPSAPQN